MNPCQKLNAAIKLTHGYAQYSTMTTTPVASGKHIVHTKSIWPEASAVSALIILVLLVSLGTYTLSSPLWYTNVISTGLILPSGYVLSERLAPPCVPGKKCQGEREPSKNVSFVWTSMLFLHSHGLRSH